MVSQRDIDYAEDPGFESLFLALTIFHESFLQTPR
jgi:hypothetical protein